ncbi:MAG: serine/threonine-protein kinase, partial [Gemmatimonadota bacterium]|nr:serine/threonine-protein kinase [Gemmatimonadota bacterium]
MSASPSPGDVISHYRILERVGAGGMGEVFRAVDERLDRTVALKLLRAEGSADPATRARFEGEARAASALDHRNVAAVYDVGEAPDGRLFIAMAFYEGETLSDRLARGGISPEETRGIGRQIAAGLERAHANGIVHRDIKPSNLMITADGEVKILDFGIAKLADRPGLTGTGVFVGTSGYMAPEQIEAGEIDGRTDVWGLGVVLYQMLTGRPPFGGATAREQLAAVLATDPTPPAVSNPAVPPDLSDLVLEMLARDPSGRPASATEVARRLARPFSGPAPPPRRTRALAGGVVAAAALVAVWFLAPGIAADPIDSIAVLPFDNASPNAEGAYLSAGLANSLVDRLSQIAGLRVVPRALAARYPTGQTDLRQAAAALDVTAIVTGEVSELGDRLIVRADLIDVRTLDNLWSGQFDEPMTDILEVHDSLVGEIVGHLRVELDPDEEEELLERATADPEAFRLVLLSRFHNLSVTEEGVALGRRYALQAIALDSTYARAWAALSDTYLTHVFMGLEAPSEAYPRAIEAAERATRLDPGLAIAYAVLGFARHHGEWDWTGAMEAWERSVELDSTLADGWQGISQGHATAGRTGRAVAAAIRALAA